MLVGLRDWRRRGVSCGGEYRGEIWADDWLVVINRE